LNSNDQKLAHAIKLKFGTAPHEPTETQLEYIKAALQTIVNSGKTPTDKEWLDIVKRYCPGTGTHVYAGQDNSDLIALLRLATKPANK
jgi:hypothetical protein